MNEQLMIYLWSISGSVAGFFYTVGVLGTFIAFFAAVGLTGLYVDGDIKTKKIFLIWIIPVITLSAIIVPVLIPSKQDIALIWAYSYIKASVTSEKVQNIPKKILNIANEYLDKELEKISNKDVEKTGE